MRRKFLSWLSICLMVLGVMLPAVTAAADHKPGSWSVQSSGPVYTGGNTVWTYTVSKTGDPHGLSHLSLEICQNYERIQSSPWYTDRGQDGSLAGTPYVLKWGSGIDDGTVITVTYPGLWMAGGQTYYVKAGQQVFSGAISGPSCTAASADFTITKSVSTTNNPATGAATAELTGGGTAYYFYTLTNTGNVPITLSSAVDDKLGALSFSASTIAAGGTATATASKSFSALPPGSGDETEVNTVTAIGSWNDEIIGPKTAQATVINRPTPGRPDFTVTKTVSTTNDPATGQASVTLTGGGKVYYFYTVTNTGDVPLMFSSAEDDILGDLTFAPDPLDPGESATATAEKSFPVLDSGSASETEVNTVTVEMWTTAEESAGTKTAEATVINNPPIEQHDPGFVLTKTVSTTNDPATGSASVTLYDGGTVYYFYTVTNTGDVPLTITQATDDKLGALTFSPLTVPAGGSATATASKTFDTPMGAETETNIAQVVAEYNGSPLAPRQATATVYNSPPPSFRITKKVSITNDPATGVSELSLQGSAAPTTIYYFFTVVNTGPVPITITSAMDDKLGALTFSPNPVPVGGTATATASKTFPGMSPSSLSVQELNTVSVTVTHNNQNYGPQTASAIVTINPPEGSPDFTVTKKVSKVNNPATGQSSVTITGGTVYYFYTITNTGSVPLALIGAVDDKLGPISLPSSLLMPGASVSTSASKSFAILPKGGSNQTEINIVTVTASYQDQPLTRSASATVVNVAPPPDPPPQDRPDFVVTKLVSTSNNPASGQSSVTLTGGGTVWYFYTLINTGNVPLTIASATDDKLGPVSFSPAVVPVGGTATATASKTFPALTPGAAAQSEVNVLSASVTYGNTTYGPRTAQATVINQSVAKVVDFAVTKKVSDTNDPATGTSGITLVNGGTVYYFYTVTNTGNVPLTISEAVDDKLGDVTFTPSVLPPGGVATAIKSKTFAAGGTEVAETNTIRVTTSDGRTEYGPKTGTAVVTVPAAPQPDPSIEVWVCETFTQIGGVVVAIGPNGERVTAAVPGPGGKYVLQGLSAGTWQVTLTGPGVPASATMTLALQADGSMPGNVYVADFSRVCPPVTGSMAGRVCSPPRPGAVITAAGPNGQTAQVAIQSDGVLGKWRNWVLENLPMGSWIVTLTTPGADPVSQTVSVNPSQTTAVGDFTLACTGESGGVNYYLLGALLVLAGVLLRLPWGRLRANRA